MPKGYMGKILRVNLSESRISEETPSEELYQKFIGGAGLATKYLIDEVPKGADPLGPENKLILMNGALGGTIVPSAGRYDVVAKSPLTGLWGHGNSGGYWGPALRRAGYDGVIVEGISPEPIYLLIEEGKAEIRDAKDIWGKGMAEMTGILKQRHGEECEVAGIGLAGENLVRYVSVMNNEHRAGGRGGMGTVMGSKRLKSIVVKGTKEIPIANAELLEEVATRNTNLINESFFKVMFESYGTQASAAVTNARGAFPTRNWQTGVNEFIESIDATAHRDKCLIDIKHCFSCPISCGRVSAVKAGKYAHTGEGPEYESVGALGSMCGLDSIEAISYVTNLCDDYSLDTISTGSTIAFAMECFEKGLLTKSDTDGIELRFGDADAVIACVHKIAKREGFGDLLAEGTKRMSERIGEGSERFAMHVKGLELPSFDPRALKMVGLAHAVASRGGDHVTSLVIMPSLMAVPLLVVPDSSIADPLIADPAEVKVVKDLEDAVAIFDCSGACKFMGLILETSEWCDMLAQATGWKFDADDFRKTGERIRNLEKLFNVREGATRADDTLPKRLFEDPLPEGAGEGHVVEIFDQLLDTYYELRGWDKETGKPSPQKLRELGLEDYIDIVR